MFKYIISSLIAILVSLIFEFIIYLSEIEVTLKISILSFFFHSLNLILTILLVINYQNYSISRLDNLKKGILITKFTLKLYSQISCDSSLQQLNISHLYA